VARDATARLYDVDASLVGLDKKAGTISFQAKKGRVVDLDLLHESIWATRLGDGTGMTLKWLDVTAEGEVTGSEKEVRLKVRGRDQYFLLGDDPNAATPKEKEAFQRLREALQRGEKVVSVMGRVENWQGNLTQFSKTLPAKPRRILVKDFQTVKP
jgi:hypothetical protein